MLSILPAFTDSPLTDSQRPRFALKQAHPTSKTPNIMVAARQNGELLVMMQVDFIDSLRAGRTRMDAQSGESHIMPPSDF
jgi:hypothetical protein